MTGEAQRPERWTQRAERWAKRAERWTKRAAASVSRRVPPRVARLAGRTPLWVKLVTAMLVLVAVGMSTAGTVAVVELRKYLLQRVDEQLRETARTMVRTPRGELLPPQQRDPGRAYEGQGRPALSTGYYSLELDADGYGTPMLRLPSGETEAPPALPRLDLAEAVRLDGQPFTARPAGHGHNWRVLVSVLPDGSGSAVVALSLGEVDETVDRVALVEVFVGLAILAALGVLGYAAIRSSLRPLMRVEVTAEAIAAGDLTRRVPPGHDRTEVGRLANALNGMLAQIEAAFTDRAASEAQAKASEARMRRFVADASHELRTPLTSIRGFAELLRRQVIADPATIPATSDRIESAASRMALLVEDLLLLARLDQQRPLRRSPVDLLALAADAVAEVRIAAPDHPVTLRAPGAADAAPPVVLGDEIRLRQIVTNLLVNACTHTPSGTPVAVTVSTAEGQAVLEVADRGPGLDPEHAQRIFERFYRADTSRTRASGGTGLGLSIVAALVAAHSGTVGAHSEPGVGTRFEVRLPLPPAESAGAVDQAGPQEPEAAGE